MTQESWFRAFDRLSFTFLNAIEDKTFDAMRQAGLHSDNLLTLSAGRDALDNLLRLNAPSPVMQQAASMNGQFGMSSASADSPSPTLLYQMVPWAAVSGIANEISRWRSEPPGSLRTAPLSEGASTLRTQIQRFAEIGPSASIIQRGLLLDMNNVALMSETLALMTSEHIVHQKTLHDLWGRMPSMNEIQAWSDFRAESLKPHN